MKKIAKYVWKNTDEHSNWNNHKSQPWKKWANTKYHYGHEEEESTDKYIDMKNYHPENYKIRWNWASVSDPIYDKTKLGQEEEQKYVMRYDAHNWKWDNWGWCHDAKKVKEGECCPKPCG